MTVKQKRSLIETIFGEMQPNHRLKISLLGSTGVAVCTIGAFSILNYLMENSEIYQEQWWMTIPLMIIPFGAGVALEQLIEKIAVEKHRRYAEHAIGAVAILTFFIWLGGLLDMASDGVEVMEEAEMLLPKGSRVISQILFEVTVIELITSEIFKIIKGYWPDEHTPGAEKQARSAARDEYENRVLLPLKNKIDKIKLSIKPYEAAREKYVKGQCAAFAVTCTAHDAYTINPEANA